MDTLTEHLLYHLPTVEDSHEKIPSQIAKEWLGQVASADEYNAVRDQVRLIRGLLEEIKICKAMIPQVRIERAEWELKILKSE